MTEPIIPPSAEDRKKKPSDNPDQKAKDDDDPQPAPPEDANKPSTSGRDSDDDPAPTTWEGPIPPAVLDFLNQSIVLAASPHLESFARAIMGECLDYKDWGNFRNDVICRVHDNAYRHSIYGNVRTSQDEVQIALDSGGWTGDDVPDLTRAFVEQCMRVPSERICKWVERKVARGDCILDFPALSSCSQVSHGPHFPATGVRSTRTSFEKILAQIEEDKEDKAAGRPAKRQKVEEVKLVMPDSPRTSLVSSLDGQVLGPVDIDLGQDSARRAASV